MHIVSCYENRESLSANKSTDTQGYRSGHDSDLARLRRAYITSGTLAVL